MPKNKTAEGQLPSLAMPPSTYTLSGDVAEVVGRVIGRFPEKFGHLVNAKLACLKRQSKRSEDAFSVDGAGGCAIRSDRERPSPTPWAKGRSSPSTRSSGSGRSGGTE